MLNYPIRFKPILQSKIWGGNKLSEDLNKLDTVNKIGESWEISGINGSESIVINGEYKDLSINELINNFKSELLGVNNFNVFGYEFPLLFKFLDASDNLSIQLHPNDELAKKRHNSFGKTEMWYVIDSDKGSKLYTGFRKGVTKKELNISIEEDAVLDLINEEEVKKGDVYFIESGTIHGIGKGVLIAEIQQTSDITYRIYDWNRLGLNNKKRELHLDLAIDAIDFSSEGTKKVSYKQEKDKVNQIVKCNFFTTNKITLTKEYFRDLKEMDTFVVYMCVEGEGEFLVNETLELVKKGDTILIPAVTESFKINTNSKIELLEVYID